jgi:hypothetical protein
LVGAVWLDEAFSFHDATGPHWPRAAVQDVPPLYPLLLGAWIRVAGDGGVALVRLGGVRHGIRRGHHVDV